MNGADYIAQVGLYTKAGDVLALPGETCARVREVATPAGWDSFLAKRQIVHRDAAPAVPVSPNVIGESVVDHEHLPNALDDAADLGAARVALQEPGSRPLADVIADMDAEE